VIRWTAGVAAPITSVIVQKFEAASILVRWTDCGICELICRKYFVDGRVQGVYYRATAARHARELGITGYAKNLPDGRVELLAYGSDAAHGELVKRLWTGSSASQVASVESVDVTGIIDVPTDFTTG
jgi:acylphosphatase